MSQAVITCLELGGSRRMVLAELDQQRKLQEFQVFEDMQQSLLNQIYVGRVDSVSSNIQAAFIRFGQDRMGYLSLKETQNAVITRKESGKPGLCVGDQLLVQVVRDAVKTKLPVLSCRLEFFGNFCIVTSPGSERGVSRKISRERAEALKSLLNHCESADTAEVGIVLRTNAEGVSEEQILEDVRKTVALCSACKAKGPCLSYGSLVYRNAPDYLQKLKGIRLQQLEALTTDLPEVYEAVAEALPELVLGNILRLYRDPKLSLSALYSLKAQTERLLKKTVWLDSGANIIVEQLETLTFIDVNSAKNISREEHCLLRINQEAAVEIARQLRLRNISGMILIDFVNMKSRQEEEELIRTIRNEIRKDHVPCSYVDLTGLGLVELTRKKVYKSLKENLSEITENS